MARERTIQNRIMAWLNRQPGVVARVLHGSAWSTAGDPDIYGCVNGRMFLIEVKQPGREPTPLQQRRLAEWKNAGALTGVAHSVREAQRLIEPLIGKE